MHAACLRSLSKSLSDLGPSLRVNFTPTRFPSVVRNGDFDAVLVRFPTIGARGVRTMAASFQFLDSFHMGFAARGTLLWALRI